MAVTNVVIGLVFSALAAVALVVNIIVASTIFCTPKYRGNACYRIILCMTCLPSVAALDFLLCGLFTAIGAALPESLERVLGTIVNANSYTVVPLDFVLAVNRLCVISNRMHSLERYHVYDILMVVTWLTGLATLALFLSPECPMAFVNYVWDSRYCHAVALIPKLEFFFLYPLVISTFVVYLVIMGVIVVKKRSISTVSSIPVSFEWSILGMSGLNFAGGVVLGVFYNVYEGVFPGDPLIAAMVTSVMISLNGIDPLFLLIVNTDLRRRSLALFRGKKPAVVNGIPYSAHFKPRISIQPTET